MNQEMGKKDKSGPAADEAVIKKKMIKRSSSGALTCRKAFEVAEELGVEPHIIGDFADQLGLKLIGCQLGLFGSPTGGKSIKPLDTVDADLKKEIESGLVNGRLPCSTAWAIAARLNLPKMTVSNACETLGLKVKPCQLGAF